MARKPKTTALTSGAGSRGGRFAALQCLDAMLDGSGNMQTLKKAFQELFEASPCQFFMDFVMPLLPKEAVVQMHNVNTAPVRVIFDDSRSLPAPEADNADSA